MILHTRYVEANNGLKLKLGRCRWDKRENFPTKSSEALTNIPLGGSLEVMYRSVRNNL